MKEKAPRFESEAAMCAHFIAHVDAKSWAVYPETGAWDILLVRKADGFQIGVQAKLRLNAKVFEQAIEDRWDYLRGEGPDCRAILVPAGDSGGFGPIAAYIGLTIVTVRVPSPDRGRGGGFQFDPQLPVESGDGFFARDWYEWCPLQRVRLPEYVPDVVAGASAPLQLTTWKLKAIKLAVLLEVRGYVTRNDFKHLELDSRRWLPSGGAWLTSSPGGGYVRGRYLPDFKAQHPVVYEQIKADIAKWRPANALLTEGAR